MNLTESMFYAILLILGLGIFLPLFSINGKRVYRLIYIVPLFVALLLDVVLFVSSIGNPQLLMDGRFVIDSFGLLVLLIIMFVTVLLVLGNSGFIDTLPTGPTFYSLIYIMLLGVVVLVFTGSISMFFAAWVLMSVASYVLAGAEKTKMSSDAALKYAIMGGISTVFIILWIGSTPYLAGDIISANTNPFSGTELLVTSALLLVVAAGFKVGVFPFQWWLPDVYSQVNGNIVSYLTGVIKIGAFAGFVRILIYTLSSGGTTYYFILIISLLSVFTMTFGNIAALITRNIPKMMAYSSIAHVGYLLVGLVGLLGGMESNNLSYVLINFGIASIGIHLIAYALSKPGIFLFLGGSGLDSLEKIKGLYKKDPYLSVSVALLVLSLLGVPPLAGFWGKLYLFQSAIEVAPWLVLIAIINSGISSFYYIRLVREIFSEPEKVEEKELISQDSRTTILMMAVLSLVLGLGLLPILHTGIKILLP